jgi:hypothetical protein
MHAYVCTYVRTQGHTHTHTHTYTHACMRTYKQTCFKYADWRKVPCVGLTGVSYRLYCSGSARKQNCAEGLSVVELKVCLIKRLKFQCRPRREILWVLLMPTFKLKLKIEVKLDYAIEGSFILGKVVTNKYLLQAYSRVPFIRPVVIRHSV